MKDLRAAEQAEIRIRRLTEREEAQGLKAQRAIDLVAARSARAFKKARQAVERQ